MNHKVKSASVHTERSIRLISDDYLQLIKPGLSMMVVFSSLCAFVIAAGLDISLLELCLLAMGGLGVTGGANAMNQALEADFDSLMERTKNRPIAAGRLSVSQGILFAGFMCLIGVTCLAYFNVVAAFFGMLAFMTYAFVYTPLKRYSTVAVFVGAIAGAMPTLIGVVAFTGSITFLAIGLFLLQFFWQYPHFWAIAFLGYKDYDKAGYKMIPVKSNSIDRSITSSSIAYGTALILLAAVMMFMQMISPYAGISLIILGLVLTNFAKEFSDRFDQASAKKLMFGSLLYLPIALIILIIDQI